MSYPAMTPLDWLKQRDFLKLVKTHRPRGMESLEARRLFAAGDLDPTFGEGGLVEAFSDATGGEIRDLAVQSDGKTVALVYSHAPEQFFVERYNRNGTLDTTFSGDGRTSFSFGEPFDPIALALHDGRIVVAGNTNTDFAVARLTSGGNLDTSFSGDGRRTIAAPNGAQVATGAMAVQSNGKIVVVGAAQRQFAVLRLNVDGSNDGSFNADGYRQIDISGSAEMAHAVAIQGDGKIVLGGHATGPTTNIQSFAVARVHGSGGLDNGFSGDGRRVTTFTDESRIRDLVIQSDGKIVAAGHGTGSAPSGATVDGIGLARYNADGSTDEGFGAGGIVSPDGSGDAYSDGATDVILQGGKIVVAADEALTRYESDGDIDPTFSGAGTSAIRFYTGFRTKALAAAPDGDLIVGGAVFGSDNRYPGMARLNADGTRDDNFGVNGQVAAWNANVIFPSDRFQDTVVQADGKVVAVMTAGTLATNSQDLVVVRYNGDGTLDTTFGDGGLQPLDLRSSEEFAALALQPDGKIVVSVGSFAASHLVRFNTDGSLDNTFSGDGKLATSFHGQPVITATQKIMIAKSVVISNTPQVAFSRYNADGTADTGYGNAGTLYVNFDGEVADFDVQQDGRVVALLYKRTTFGGVVRRITRLTADGSGEDPTFAANEASLNVTSYTEAPRYVSLKVQPDGKIVVAQTHDERGDDDARYASVFRLNADGTRDISFTSGGATVFQSPGEDLIVYDMAIQQNGKIVIATSRSPVFAPGPSLDVHRWALHRVDTTGGRDSSFGTGGTLLTGDGLYYIGHAPRIALAPDGGIVLATYLPDPAYIYRRPALARYEGDPTGTTPDLPGVSLREGVLSFTGTGADEAVSIWKDGETIVVWVDGATDTFDAAAITRIKLSGNGGNDYLKIHPALSIPALLLGGEGDNRLIGGLGNDTLIGDNGADLLEGGDGNDSLAGGFGRDTLNGGSGTDIGDGGPRDPDTYVNIEIRPAAPNIRIVDRILTADGSWGQDWITIERVATDDVIVRGNGVTRQFDMDDFDGVLLRGNNGYDDLRVIDPVVAGSLVRKVTLEGGLGNDSLAGSAGDDVLRGGDGHDDLNANGGRDALFGEGGDDHLAGGDGNDFLEAGAGHDTLRGDGGADTLLGLAGNDRLTSSGDGLKDSVDGGAGSDSAEVDELLDDVTGVENFI